MARIPVDKSSGTSWAVLCLILLLGLAGRIWLAAHNTYPGVDGVFYLEQSRSLVRDGTLPFSSFPPGWPLLAAIPLAFRDPENSLHVLRAAQGANVLFGTLWPLLTFLALRRLGMVWALLGAALLTVLPVNLILSKGDLSEMSYSCFLLTGWLLSERRLRLPGGLVLGYSYLIRPEAALAAAGLWLWHVVRERGVPRLFTLGVLIPVVPYLLFIRSQAGHWSLSAKGVFLSRSLAERSPGEFLALVGSNLAVIWPMLAALIGLPLVLLALWGAWAGRGRWLLFLLPLLPLPLFDFVMVPRFWVPYLPFVLLAAGLGGAQLVHWSRDRWSRLGRFAVPAFLICTSLGGFAVAAWDDIPDVKINPEGYRGLREAGEWLARRVDAETPVAAYKPYASFWAGCRFLPYPKGESDPVAIVDYARRHHARYLIANVKVVHRFVPALDPLLGSPLPDSLADKLVLVQLLQYDQTIQTTAIYAITRPRPGVSP